MQPTEELKVEISKQSAFSLFNDQETKQSNKDKLQ